jgi:hypothetical protein
MQAKLASCQHLEKPMQRSAATSPIKPISLYQAARRLTQEGIPNAPKV